MIHALAMQVLGLAKRVPVSFWLVSALLLAVPIAHCHGERQGYKAGREAVLETLRKEQAAADKRALEAMAKADGRATLEVQRFEAEQETLSQAIKKAEKENRNPLDELF